MKERTRKFEGKQFGLVKQCFTKFDALKIAKRRSELGLKSRITKVKVEGMRGMAYEVWGD